MSGFSSPPFDLAAATPALLVLLKVSAVLVLALALTALMERASATARHLVWVATLAALVAIPVMTLWTPVHLAILPSSWSATPTVIAKADAARASASAVAMPSKGSEFSIGSFKNSDPWLAKHADPMAGSKNSDPLLEATPARSSFTPSSFELIALAWAVVSLALLGWLAAGALGVRRIVRSSKALTDDAWQSLLIDTADRLQLHEVPRLLSSARVTMPFAAGLRRPTIVLPVDCETWTQQRRAAVLLHELAHIRRRDIVAHTLGRIVCAVYWFHPLAWTAARRLRAESERACDDLALTCGTRASDYAEHLLEIVTSVRNHGTPSMAMAMATRSEFEGRMLAILDPTLTRTSPTRVQASTLAGGVMMFAIVAGAATPMESPSSPSSPPSSANVAELSGVGPADDQSGEPSRALVASDTGKRSRLEGIVSSERPLDARRDPRDDDAEGVTGTRAESRAEAIAEARANARANARAEVRLQVETDDVRGEVTGRGSVREQVLRLLSESAPRADSNTRASVLARVLRTDTSASLRRTAAWGLNDHTENRDALSALQMALGRDASAEVREMAAWSLSDAADQPGVAAVLAEALRQERDRKVRKTIVWSIGEGGSSRSTEAIAALASAISDDDEQMRELAVWGIGNMEPKKAPASVIAALTDRSAGVRATAAWALYQIEDGEAAGALEAALQRETERDAKWSMVRALSVMGERAVAPLQRLIEGNDAQLRTLAIRSLAGAGGDPWPQPRPRPRPYP